MKRSIRILCLALASTAATSAMAAAPFQSEREVSRARALELLARAWSADSDEQALRLARSIGKARPPTHPGEATLYRQALRNIESTAGSRACSGQDGGVASVTEYRDCLRKRALAAYGRNAAD